MGGNAQCSFCRRIFFRFFCFGTRSIQRTDWVRLPLVGVFLVFSAAVWFLWGVALPQIFLHGKLSPSHSRSAGQRCPPGGFTARIRASFWLSPAPRWFSIAAIVVLAFLERLATECPRADWSGAYVVAAASLSILLLSRLIAMPRRVGLIAQWFKSLRWYTRTAPCGRRVKELVAGRSRLVS